MKEKKSKVEEQESKDGDNIKREWWRWKCKCLWKEERAEKRAENHLKHGKQQILPALLGIAGSPYLLQAPCYQKPSWLSNLTPPGSMCLDGRTISLLNESLNHCHFSPKKKAGKTVVCFLQTNGSPEVNSSFIWSHPSWEILLVEMFRSFFFIFIFFCK